MDTLLLNDGHYLPKIGFGTYKCTEDEGLSSLKTALDQGYRLIDTAAYYFNEEIIGKGIRESGVAREEIIVTTKVWREHLGYEATQKAFQESLTKLGLDYVDVYLIHWPANAKNFADWQRVNAETWRAMEDLQAAGKIKSIGLSNFWPEHLDALLKTARVKPALNQIEFHPGYWQPDVLRYCQDHGIAVEGWSPLARGMVFQDETIRQIAKQHEKSVAQVCLRWAVQHGVVPIPKSNTPERIAANLEIFDFELSPEEMKAIDALPQMGFSGELPNEWPDRE